MNSGKGQHEWFGERIAAFVAGGLEDAERERFEEHARQCAACTAALGEAKEEDRAMAAVFADVRPGEGFEERVIAGLRQRWTRWRVVIHPMVRRAAAAVAATILLGTAGYVASPWIREGRLPMVTAGRQYASAARVGKSFGPFVVADGSGEPVQGASNLRQMGQGSDMAGRLMRDRRRVDPTGVRNLTWGASATNGEAGPYNGRDSTMVPVTTWDEDGETRENPKHGDGIAVGRTVSVGDGGTLLMGGQTAAPTASAPPAGGPVVFNQNSVDYRQLSSGEDRDFEQPNDDYGGGRAMNRSHFAIRGDSLDVSNSDGRFDDSKDVKLGRAFQSGQNLYAYRNAAPAQTKAETSAFRPAELTSKGPTGEAIASKQQAQKEGVEEHKGVEHTVMMGLEARPAQVAQATNGQSVPSPRSAPTDLSAQRKIIRNGEVEFEVASFDSAFGVIAKIVAEEQGFISSSDSQKLPNGKMKGTVVVRVPPEHLDTLVMKLRALGELKGQRIAAQDITKQYTDLESGLRAAKAMEERLLEIIKTGKGEIKDLVAAEKELGVWREKIEQITGEIRYYNNLVSLSTLSISLTEKDIRTAASVSETEQRNVGIETEDVEKAYADAQSAIAEVKGRIVESDLKKYDAGQLAARVVCDVAPDSAGPLTDRLKQLGKMARLDIERRQSTQGETPVPSNLKVERKDTRFLISLYNLANVAPRQTMNLNLACQNVEQQYQAILARVQKASGRIVTSNLSRQKPEQTTATVSFEVKSSDADAVQQEIGWGTEASDVQVLRLTSTDNPDTKNVTDAKRGFAVQLVSLASVAPRETVSVQVASTSVTESYRAMVEALNAQAIEARIIASQLNQQDEQNVSGSLDFEVRRGELAAAEKALTAAGDAFARSSLRSTDTENTVDSKVRLQVSLISAQRLPPRETTTMGIEVADVEKARGDLQTSAAALGGRAAESRLSKERNGQVTARLVLELPLDKAPQLLTQARAVGTVRNIETATNAQVPRGALTRARIDVMLSNAEGLVSADRGIWATIRNGLSTSLAGLLWSLQLIVIGLLLVVPWVVVIWGGWKLFRWRSKRAAVAPSAGA